ncbi:MAG: lipopolysaccharide biosynthesis protein, partial [Betaproteobacteria bacterium]
PAEFGGFTLVYSILLVANCVQSGLIIQPHNIFGANRRGADYIRYTASMAAAQLVLALGFILLTLLAWLIAHAYRWEPGSALPHLALPLLAWQLQEFLRRVLYTEGRLTAVLVNDAISYGGQAGAIAALLAIDRLTIPLALGTIAATSASAAALGAWQLRGSLSGPVDLKIIRANWHFGKWLAGSNLVGDLLYNQVFVYMAAAASGVTAAGIVKAVTTVFGPLRVLIAALNMALPVHFARVLAAEGTDGLYQKIKQVYGAALPLLGGYCLIAGAFAGSLLRLFYGSRYADQSAVLRLYAACTLISSVGLISCNALKARGFSRHYFTSHLAVGLVTLPVSWALIAKWGVEGAVLGMMVASTVFTVKINTLLYDIDLH